MARRKKTTDEGASASSLVQIQITKKRVTGDNGSKHLMDDRLFVGKDVSVETAAAMVENGVAIEIDGKLPAEIEEEKAEGEAKNRQQLTKQNADASMTRFDRMDAEARERARNEPVIEEGEDVDMFPDDEVQH